MVPELELHQAIGCRLRFLRKKLKVFAHDLGGLIGLTRNGYNKYEIAQSRVPLAVLINTANLFTNTDDVLLWLIGRVVGEPPTFNVKEEYKDEIEKFVAIREYVCRTKRGRPKNSVRHGGKGGGAEIS